MQAVEIKKDIYWVGAVDWDVRDFHGYSTPVGTTYNAYLVMDEKVAVFDTVKHGFIDTYFNHIGNVIEPEKIDYLIINHVEMDHSGGFLEVVDRMKPEKIFCSANGKKALLAHFHREDLPYEVIKSGDTINLGKHTVKFIETKMLHWPDSMFSYFEEDKLLISQDAFGLHYATSERFDDELKWPDLFREAEKYYANILLPYSNLIQKLLKDVGEMGIEFDMIAPDHGPIWRGFHEKIIESYASWSKQETAYKAVVIYDTMWHSTEKMAHAVADGLMDEGASVKVLNMRYCHRSDVMTDLMDAGAIVLGSATLNNGILPRMADVTTYMKGLKPVGRIGGAFGSYGWGGEAVKILEALMTDMKIELVDQGLRSNYVPTADDLAKCTEYGRKIALAMKSKQQQ